MKKLTDAQIRALIHARKQGAIFPHPGNYAGGAIYRMAERMVQDGLVEAGAPFKITSAGRKAVEGYDDHGLRKSRVTKEALEELDRRHRAGEDMRGMFSIKTGKPIKQSAQLAAINAELAGMTDLQPK